MLRIIPLILLLFFSFLSVYAQDRKLLASCCDTKPKEDGRCTGSASCSACSNCSRCAHCSNGGSCGVCATYSQPVRYKAPRRASEKAVKTVSKSTVSNPSKSSFSTQPKERIKNKSFMNNYRSNDMLAVDSDILNLRNGPGIEYEAIEILKKHALLKLIAIDGEWLQVKVIESGNYGYVNAKYVYKT